MIPVIECAVCDGYAHLKTEIKKRTYRGDVFEVYEHFYVCDKCQYSFTNEDADRYNVQLVHNMYREKNNIPFAEQLARLRESYGLSQAKMSELLGFGPNQYRLYENGDIPVGGNATVLSMIVDPNEFKKILIKKSSFLTEKKLDETIKRIERLIDNNSASKLKEELFPSNIIPGRLTGFSIPSFEKFANIVIYLLNNAPFKTRLNKLLFYSDFAHFKYYGRSISGCRYAALPMGSVPVNYSLIFGLLEKEDYLNTEVVEINNKENEKFTPGRSFDSFCFSISEIEILNKVLETFKNFSTQELIEVSHKELAWINNEKNRSRIDYSIYAPQLIAI